MRSRSLIAIAVAVAALVCSTRANAGNPAVPEPGHGLVLDNQFRHGEGGAR